MEIKFRMPFYNNQNKFAGFAEVNPIKGLSPYNRGVVHPRKLEQYSGHKDKYGQEIYDGDIFKKGNALGYVFWCEEDACFRVCFLPTRTYANLWEIGAKDFCEVIGNIHDNPELLEGK